MSYKKIIAGLLIISSVIAIAGFINADDYPIGKIAAQLNKWKDNYPLEKVYLQFDKPYYAVGDDIWFKAYVTIGGKHELSALSGALNVELIDDKDSVKQSIKLPLINGLTWGDFAIPDTLEEGNYRIRAYTNYMRNAGEDYFFDKAITILNSTTNKVFTKTTYTYGAQNGKQQVSALINYADINGTPYAKKEVRYTVQLNDKQVSRGKGITDDKGNINISFVDAQSALARSGTIATTIKLDDKRTIAKNIPVKATSANVDVQFFPESGNIVNGLNSKVAFKATGADGLGADIKGTLTDDQNNTITTFSSRHLGMGLFTFIPQRGRSYKANITFADGSTKGIDLPKTIDKGYVLDIDNSDKDDVNLKISASHEMLADSPDDTISVIGQSGGQIYYAASSKASSSNFTATVSKSRFPSGIVQFTLFSSKGEPLNERLVFMQNPDQLKLDVKAAKQIYAPRENVKINLNAKDGDSKPVVGSFSVAVVDETKVPVNEADESTILSNLLLTSDLKGYIEKPNYYFTNVNETTQADLDVLMLTQGYRRFEWKRILKDDMPPLVYEPEKTLQISGHIKTLGGKPVPHGKVMLLSTKHGTFILDTVADEQGKFVFDNLVFDDSARFVIQARTSKDRKNVEIDLDNINSQKVTQNKNAPDLQVNVSDGLSTYMQNSKSYYEAQLKYGLGNHVVVLKEVVIKDKREILKHSDNLNGPGNADQIIMGDKLLGCPTLDVCLQGALFGVIFRNGMPYSTRGGALTINVDGMFLQGDDFKFINASDISSIEVLRTPTYYSIYGSQAGPGGVILITTKRGDENQSYLSRPAPGIITLSPKGFYKTREFYSPKYDDPKTNATVADLRSTIYWKPNIITDKEGNASFDFFNAGKGTYRVVIEGIDIDGNIGRQVYRYKVE
jgi:hypothetical protein